MTKHKGTWGGVFLKGSDIQIGLLSKWTFSEKTLPVGDSVKGELKRERIVGWSGKAKTYYMDTFPPDEVEFRFAEKACWHKCYGTFTSLPIVGQEINNIITMQGESPPRIKWRE